jgi:hypothetical protein
VLDIRTIECFIPLETKSKSANRIKRVFSLTGLITVTGLLVVAGSISGCYYDVEEELYPQGNCDTAVVSYTTVVAPMLQKNGCLGCHAAPASAGNGIVLDSYTSILNLVQDNNRFVSGADRMPPGSPSGVLSECDMSKLRAWASAGAPNN